MKVKCKPKAEGVFSMSAAYLTADKALTVKETSLPCRKPLINVGVQIYSTIPDLRLGNT